MTLIEINYTPTLQEQFKSVGRRRHKYKFIDCTKAVLSLKDENIQSAHIWPDFFDRVCFFASTMKPDIIASPVSFNEWELNLLLGKKGIFIEL